MIELVNERMIECGLSEIGTLLSPMYKSLNLSRENKLLNSPAGIFFASRFDFNLLLLERPRFKKNI